MTCKMCPGGREPDTRWDILTVFLLDAIATGLFFTFVIPWQYVFANMSAYVPGVWGSVLGVLFIAEIATSGFALAYIFQQLVICPIMRYRRGGVPF